VELVILGTAGHAGVVAEAAVASGWTVGGFVGPRDPNFTASPSKSFAPISDEEFFGGNLIKMYCVAIGVGNQQLKRQLATMVIDLGGALTSIIHPRAYVSNGAQIGAGTFIAAGAVVSANASIGRFCIINTLSSVDHDSELDDGVQVCPGAHLAGHVKCGADVFIGSGAVVTPGLSIGRQAVVGAGAILLTSLDPGVRAFGCPAKPR